MERLRPCFARTQTWQQATKYVSALASDVPKRNGWTIAEYVGDRSPNRTQRLLNRAVWDGDEAMSLVRRFVVDGLGTAARRRRRGLVVGALDETGQQKRGSATCGVKRQYMGCAGRVENGINTVHLGGLNRSVHHPCVKGPGTPPAPPADARCKPWQRTLPRRRAADRARQKAHPGPSCPSNRVSPIRRCALDEFQEEVVECLLGGGSQGR